MKRSEHEAVILSTLLRSPSFLELATLLDLRPEHFSTPAHIYLYGAIHYLRRREYLVTPFEIARVLRARKQWKTAVSETLVTLNQGESATGDVRRFARSVKAVRGKE